MKLIAETEEENIRLRGIGALLTELGICATEYRTDEAYALVFWSAIELSHLYSSRFDLTYEAAASFLDELEPQLHMAMSNAGAELIEETLAGHLSPVNRPAGYPGQDRFKRFD